MIGLFLQTYGSFGSGAIGNVLQQWSASGVFAYIIPFLLIFAIVYGILVQVKLFGGPEKATGRTINAIIALAVGLMSLQFDFVGRFFAEIFPRVGIGLVVLLLVIIFTGLFADPKQKSMIYVMYAIGAIILFVILGNSSDAMGWFGFSSLYGINWYSILPWVILIALIVAVISAGKNRNTDSPDGILARALRGP